MQSLSKIERGLNYPAYEMLEKIMEVLDVTPNELLSGEWKYINQSEKEICQFLRAEERLNAELKHGHYDNFFDSEEMCNFILNYFFLERIKRLKKVFVSSIMFYV